MQGTAGAQEWGPAFLSWFPTCRQACGVPGAASAFSDCAVPRDERQGDYVSDVGLDATVWPAHPRTQREASPVRDWLFLPASQQPSKAWGGHLSPSGVAGHRAPARHCPPGGRVLVQSR